MPRAVAASIPSSALWVRPTRKPSAVAPQSRAAFASSQVRMPHTFTNAVCMGTPTMAPGRGWSGGRPLRAIMDRF